MRKQLTMRYFSPAERTDEGWEKYSIPLGNGYFGASVFGGTDIERIQFTTNVFACDFHKGGVSNFAEIHLHFPQGEIKDYERGLRLNTGIAYSRYACNGNQIHREAFVSYPDKVFAYRIKSGKEHAFFIELIIPYLGKRPIEEGGRQGQVCVENQMLVMRGVLPFRELLFEGRAAVITNGSTRVKDGKIFVENATETTLLFTLDTSYKLCPEMFFDGNHKALGDDPHTRVVDVLKNACSLGWAGLYANHEADYTSLMGRVELDLGGVDDGSSTEALLLAYQKGESVPYLEEVYYQYGRYLLVSSSRKGTPPSSLQGVWTVHDISPWGSGYWHNINVQMNYWHAFSSNVAECFSAYTAFFLAYKTQAERYASAWIQEIMPEDYETGDGACGWTIGTGAYCYEIEGQTKNGHSGPGTGGLTAKMFWDYYDFTRDEQVLKEITYPAIHGMATFLEKCTRDYNGEYLCAYSASPEQILSGDIWVDSHKEQKYYRTIGCAFDQQMLYENAQDDLKCGEILKKSDATTLAERAHIDKYVPVQIGYSGQIKEYGEEHFYGEIGEAKHRHISQLVGLMPGSTITRETPAWLDSAKRTLELRGDESTGWALAHRLCAWARCGDGDHTYQLLQNLLKMRTYPNLWDVHPPFQIDGNFGATAGITEMLVQSHDGYITLLPAIPKTWKNVSFYGLKARGNFTLSCVYKEGEIQKAEIVSNVGGEVKLRAEGINSAQVWDETGTKVEIKREESALIFVSERNKNYFITNFSSCSRNAITPKLFATWEESGVQLRWDSKDCVAVYRAVENEPRYTLLCKTDAGSFLDSEYTNSHRARITYKIVMAGENHSPDENGSVVFMHPATKLEEERYLLRFALNNMDV